MTKILWLLFINSILFKISHAQCSNHGGPNALPATKQPTQTLAPTPQNIMLERGKPKCYPETATAYFMPAPPSAPKITFLNPKDVNFNFEVKPREPISLKEEPSSLLSSSCRNFPPTSPTPCLTGLPDVLDAFPSLLKDRFSRLAESDEDKPVCESCANLLKKFPIFNFDQELLNGFLAGIGL